MGNRILIDESDTGTVTLRLNRPEAHNAIDSDTIDELSATLSRLNGDSRVRSVVLRGNEHTFCAGVDIAWMQHMASNATIDDARRVAHLLLSLRNLSKPTIAVLEGPCVGGGVAIAAVCDITIAAEDAYFALPATHLGTLPAVIAPFVIEVIGLHQARRYFLTGERFTPERAREINLVHAICMRARIEETLEGFLADLRKGAPRTQAQCKELINDYAGREITSGLIEDMTRRIAENRRSHEAEEGLAAFLDKRPPSWLKG